MKRGDPVKQRQLDYRLEENEEGDAALELTLGPPGEEPCKKKGNQGTLHFLSLGTPPSFYLKVSEEEEDGGERKAGAYFVPPPLAPTVQKSQKRCAPAAVVGWPPVRSYRRNIAGSSGGKLQPVPETPPKRAVLEKPVNVQSKGLFVKINMDGVPIGRKVDLKSCGSYEKLESAVDELFRGLLAAQTDSSGHETEKPIAGLLDGTGEYTLVYEDHEGDRMLVGDVPWRMFVATAKRLRVLKRCDLTVINLGGRKQENKSAL